ncbi:MAG: hypothetical protein ABIH23_21875 [bacterium]
MKKSTQMTLAIVLITFFALPASTSIVVDRTPEGVCVGKQFLPSTIPFEPDKLRELTCFAPTPERPLYEIAIPIGDWDGGKGASVGEVTINGKKRDLFTVYSDGRSHHHANWITQNSESTKNIVVLVIAPWRNGERIDATVEITHSANAEKRSFSGTAPGRGGIPSNALEYESFALAEEAGLDRKAEPCEVAVSVYLDEIVRSLAEELRLYRMNKEGDLIPVPIQVFDEDGVPGVIKPAQYYQSRSNYLYSPSKTARIFFLAEVPANGTVPYVITYGDASPPPAPQPKSTLKIEGEAPGFVVSNEYYTCVLHPKCGQINSLKIQGEAAADVPVLTNHLTMAAHWNPDSYGANGKWGHTFAWDPPDHVDVATRGPLMLRITNSGRMPDETPQVYASVSYSFYAGVPYVGVTTMMEVRDPYSASALRNGELVLDTHLMTHFVWKDKAGQLNRIPTMPRGGILDDLAIMTEPDVPWLAMTNELDGYGIAAIWTTSDAFDRERGTRPVFRPGYFLYSHHEWGTPLTYFTRAWVYPFSYKGRRPNIMVEPGAVYLERGVFYPFLFKPGSEYKQVETVDTMLRQPLIRKTGN